MSLTDNLTHIRLLADRAIVEVQSTPEMGALSELFEALTTIENHYREWCEQNDTDFDQPKGTTYTDGVSLEYYIEADWWHQVSLALRKLRPDTMEMKSSDFPAGR